MKPLLLRLKREQKSIVATLDKAKRFDIQTLNGRNALKKLQKKLQAHREFPRRLEAPDCQLQETSPELQTRFQIYSHEIDALLKKLDKFSNPGFLASIQGKSCHQDFSRLVNRFRLKISRDEFRFFSADITPELEQQKPDPFSENPSG